MHPAIKTVSEGRRGCGWRKPGGIYLTGPDDGYACGRLPIPLNVCPCCGAGFKPSRGWTWVDGDRLLRMVEGTACQMNEKHCGLCVITRVIMNLAEIGEAGMIWVGESYYAHPYHFQEEAARMGISRRIKMVPNDFKLGETYVLLAHKKAVAIAEDGGGIVADIKFSPGVFRIWKPTDIEVVVTGEESSEEIEGYLARGLTPVKVERTDYVEQDEMELA